jgi:hypothetical protein
MTEKQKNQKMQRLILVVSLLITQISFCQVPIPYNKCSVKIEFSKSLENFLDFISAELPNFEKLNVDYEVSLIIDDDGIVTKVFLNPNNRIIEKSLEAKLRYYLFINPAKDKNNNSITSVFNIGLRL